MREENGSGVGRPTPPTALQTSHERKLRLRREWYRRNRESEIERTKRWQRENRERALAGYRRYYAENREHCLAVDAEYAAVNAERISERKRRYNAVNRERNTASRNAWRAQNPERNRAQVAAYRARRLAATVVGFDVEQLVQRLSMFDGCWMCGGEATQRPASPTGASTRGTAWRSCRALKS